MKKFLCLLLCLCALTVFTFGVLADSTPIIYKVTGSEGHYLFLLGTMHVIDDDTLPIARMDELLDQVDTVVLELGSDFFEPLLSAEGTSFEDRLGAVGTDKPNELSDELLEKLAVFFCDECGCEGVSANTLKYVHAYDLYTLLLIEALRSAGMDVSGAAVDKYVYQEAVKRGLNIYGAETIEEQNDAIGEYFGGILGAEGEQIDESAFHLLMNSLPLVKFSMGMLCTAYNSGNRALLMTTVVNPYPRSDVDVVRNARFFKATASELENGGRALIAVGLYHVLCEEDGLITQLTAAGYTVEVW